MKKLYIWYWKQGGYNSCWALSKQGALDYAKSMKCVKKGVLTMDEETLHEGTEKELHRLDAMYR